LASDEDQDLEEIEAELARVEEQIQDLERRSEPPEPEAPDPDDPDTPAPEEALEGELDVDREPSRLDRLRAKLGNLREKADEARSEDEDDDEEADEGASLPFLGSEETDDAEPDEGSDPNTLLTPHGDARGRPPVPAIPEEDPIPDASDEDDGLLGGALGFGSEETDDAEPEPEPTEDGEDDGFIAGTIGGLGDHGDPDEPLAEEEAQARELDDEVEAPPPAGPADEPAQAAEDEPEDGEGARASALLARFQSGETETVEEDEEDDDRGGLLIAGLVVLLLLGGLAAAAYAFLPADDGGGDLDAALVADSFRDDQDRFVATTGQPITLDASDSSGEVDTYAWSFGDGEQTTTDEATVEHTYAQRGTYTVELTLQSGDSEASTTIEVTAVDPPKAEPSLLVGGQPAAEPATVGNNAYVGDDVTLDGTASTADPEHRITSYTWDVNGDGEIDANGAEASLAFDEPGAWFVNLTVGDDLGNEEQASRILHVSDRFTAEGTLGPSTTGPDSDAYSIPVDRARLGAEPIQLEAELAYNASGGNESPVLEPEVDPDLDLNLTDSAGNVYQAEDDDGEGQESITLTGGDLAALGDWNVTVAQDNQDTGTASEADYELVVRTIY
jgi:chitodextrinase